MRKFVLAACLCLPMAAHAQVAVADGPLTAIQNFMHLQQIKDALVQARQLEQEAQTAIQALQIAQGIVHNPTNFGAYLALGSMAGINLQSTLPIDPYTLMALTSGYSGAGISGMLGKASLLGNLVNTNANGNMLNNCTAATFACQLSNQKRYAAAGQQAAAQQVAQDMNNHMIALTALKTRCLASPDGKDAQDCGNQIQIETAAIQADAAQLQAVQSMATAQAQIFDNRASEDLRAGHAASLAAFTSSGGAN